jgi:hypothetical protein
MRFRAISGSFAHAAGVCAILVGIVGVAASILHVEVLRIIYQSRPETTPAGELVLSLTGVAFLFELETNTSALRRKAAKAAAIVCLVTVFVLASLVFAAGWKSLKGIAPANALTLGINGIALLLVTMGWGISTAQGMGLMAAFIAMLPITGWLFDIPTLHSMGKYDPISAPIAVMSALLGLAIVLDGPSTIRALETMNPNIKIIAASGLLDHPKHLGGFVTANGSVRAVLAKPYTAEKLLTTLASVLAEQT